VRIGNITFAQHTLVVTSALIIIGFQAVEFWVFAKVIAMQRGLLVSDPVFNRLRRLAPLERCLAAGAALVLCGGLAVLIAVGYWSSFGFADRFCQLRT
jgi:uncharacterized membrane protein